MCGCVKEYVNVIPLIIVKTLKLRKYRSRGRNYFYTKFNLQPIQGYRCYSCELFNYDDHLHMSSIN